MLNGRSCWKIEREEGINHSITNRWLNKYNEQGIKGLENQKKPGNPLCKYSNKKNLSDMEKLEYEIRSEQYAEQTREEQEQEATESEDD